MWQKKKKHLSLSFCLSPSLLLDNVEVIHQLGAAIFKGHILQNRGSCRGSLLNPIIFQKPKTTWMLLIDTCIYHMNIHAFNKQYHPGATNKLWDIHSNSKKGLKMFSYREPTTWQFFTRDTCPEGTKTVIISPSCFTLEDLILVSLISNAKKPQRSSCKYT